MVKNEYGIELEENMDIETIEYVVHKQVKKKLFMPVYVNVFIFYVFAIISTPKSIFLLMIFGVMVIINAITTMANEEKISNEIIEEIKKYLKYKSIR